MGKGQSFFKTEDFWAMAIGGLLLVAGLGIFFSQISNELKSTAARHAALTEAEAEKPFKSIAWHQSASALEKQKLSATPVGKFLKKLTAKPNTWTARPWEAFNKPAQPDTVPDKTIAPAFQLAKEAEQAARSSNFNNVELNAAAAKAIAAWQETLNAAEKKQAKLKAGSFSGIHAIGLFVLLALLFGFGAKVQGTPLLEFVKGFAIVFLLALLSLFLAGQKNLHDLGIEYAVWAIFIGMLISNTVGTPAWAAGALKTEFYIKSGLVLMGAEVLINKILAIGLPGMFVAWVVTPVVLVSTFWFGQKVLKITSKSLNITISADMSVCGVSAAVATAAASKASREELTVAIGLSMVFTAIMMVVMPLFIKFIGMPEVLGGAWIGGTVDSSGAVVAAGAALGDKAMYVAATIKMIQNMLIGLVAFGVAVYFATKVEKNEGKPKIGLGEIWLRFPKFILGFVGASLLFSAIYALLGQHLANAVIDEGVLNAFTKNLRTWFFCLAFASIGLSTNFRELRQHFTGGKPLLLYVCGQALNLVLTLAMAYLMFYLVFPEITEKI
jgi:uncharacterized integral membrane protein (TIGR00698 family)